MPVRPSSLSRRITILDVPIDLTDMNDITGLLREWLDGSSGMLRHIVTVNPEYVVAARRNRRFRSVLCDASLALADGVGLLVAARIQQKSVPARVTGNDLVESVAALDHENKRIFLLGAAEGVAEEAASVLRRRYQAASIVGTLSGSPTPEGWAEISRALLKSSPNVLFVAFGHPRQDLWIAANRKRLESHGILVASGVGGVYDYLSGRVPRAPAIMRRIGLEWLYRLVRQPWRWRRQAALPVFMLLVIVEAIRLRSSSS